MKVHLAQVPQETWIILVPSRRSYSIDPSATEVQLGALSELATATTVRNTYDFQSTNIFYLNLILSTTKKKHFNF